MDEKQQAEGERRVRDCLIVPLEALGLSKPSTLRKAQFDDMKRELCQKLAYMSEDGLGSLREWVEAYPGGKDQDRFPIALKILKRAQSIEQPEAGPSPLIRKVFADDLGRVALEGGYAPELLVHLRAKREWPGAWTLSQLKRLADEPVRQMRDIEMRMARGDRISSDDARFRSKRLAAIRACQEIRDVALVGQEAG